MTNQLTEIIKNRHNQNIKGVYCACTANETVLRVCMERAKISDTPLIIEATANQVNQYGGYTGMRPQDYVDFIYALAKEEEFPVERIILGGDHLGPLTWSGLPALQAMAEAEELVRLFVIAGFTKIHLDTSMHLADDDQSTVLATKTIAERGGRLAWVARDAYRELLKSKPKAIAPCFIIGSEVPIPGGEQEDTGLAVTKASDFRETVQIYQTVFEEMGLSDIWPQIVGVVVQPGVEFGDDTIHEYDRVAASELIAALDEYPQLVFEGHSTDYQTKDKLRAMVDDGIAMLKVGPALTYYYRQGLFALAKIEEELLYGDKELSNFIETLETQMLAEPKDWEKYYHGDANKMRLARKYSYSDRCRYYLPKKQIAISINKLLRNFTGIKIPLTLISQYMPLQYAKVRDKSLANEALELVKDFIAGCIDDYLYAIKR